MKRQAKRIRKNRGFTLIEVLLVLAILVVVAGAVALNVTSTQDAAYKKMAQSEVARLKNYVKQYQLMVGTLPSTLDALHAQPTDIADPSKWTQILDKPLSPDPWGRPYEYKPSGSAFEIRSLGPDGQSNTEDDITA